MGSPGSVGTTQTTIGPRPQNPSNSPTNKTVVLTDPPSMKGKPTMRSLLVAHLFLCLALVPGCGRATPSLTPDELAANWEKHKGQTVVLSGSPKIVVAGKQLAIFYETGGNYRILAEVAEGFESLKSGQHCKLRVKGRGLEVVTMVRQ